MVCFHNKNIDWYNYDITVLSYSMLTKLPLNEWLCKKEVGQITKEILTITNKNTLCTHSVQKDGCSNKWTLLKNLINQVAQVTQPLLYTRLFWLKLKKQHQGLIIKCHWLSAGGSGVEEDQYTALSTYLYLNVFSLLKHKFIHIFIDPFESNLIYYNGVYFHLRESRSLIVSLFLLFSLTTKSSLLHIQL